MISARAESVKPPILIPAEANQNDKRSVDHKPSTRECNLENLLEKEIRDREQRNRYFGRNYKKRKLPSLDSDDITAILHSYLVEHLTQDETARRFRVSMNLVSRLVCMAKKNPSLLRERKQKEKEHQQKRDMIISAAQEMLNSNIAITSCRIIKEKVEHKNDIQLGKATVNQVLRNDMGLLYRRTRGIPS